MRMGMGKRLRSSPCQLRGESIRKDHLQLDIGNTMEPVGLMS